MKEEYEKAEHSITIIANILEKLYTNWDTATFYPKDILIKKGIFVPDYLVDLSYEGNFVEKGVVFIDTPEGLPRRVLFAKIKKYLSNEELDFVLIFSSRPDKWDGLTSGNFVIKIVKVDKKQLKNFGHYKFYSPCYKRKEIYFKYSKKWKNKELTPDQIINKLGLIIETSKDKSLSSEFIEGLIEYSIGKVLNEFDSDELYSKKELEIQIDLVEVLEEELLKKICDTLGTKSIQLYVSLDIGKEIALYQYTRFSGDFGNVSISRGGILINIRDILNEQTNSYYDRYATKHLVLSLHLLVDGLKEQFSEILLLDKHLSLFHDCLGYNIKQKQHLRLALESNYTKLFELLKLFKDCLDVCRNCEIELAQYKPDDPGEDFLPDLQINFINSIRNFYNAWYTLLGALAVIYPYLIDVPQNNQFSASKVKDQLSFYKSELGKKLSDYDWILLDSIRRLRSTIISHPKSVGYYNWGTVSVNGLSYAYFYRNLPEGINHNPQFLDKVLKEREMTKLFPLSFNKSDLWKDYFPCIHPNRVFQVTMKLIEGVFLESVERLQCSP